jgi:hypothetical protein
VQGQREQTFVTGMADQGVPEGVHQGRQQNHHQNKVRHVNEKSLG